MIGNLQWSMVLSLLLALFTTVAGGNQPPRWSHFKTSIMVAENTTVDTVLLRLSVFDIDENDEIIFTLAEGITSEILRMEPLNMTTDVLVLLQTPLDRESQDQYELEFRVTDGIHELSRKCNMFVIDVNDNPPIFTGLPYKAAVPEDTAVGEDIFIVTATDADTGVYTLFTYNLQTYTDQFYINTISGHIKLRRKLDISQRRNFILEVIATDGGGMNSSADVHVEVLQSPVIQGSRQILHCYICSDEEDCSKQQLSYSYKKRCAQDEKCYMEAYRSNLGWHGYTRDCRGATWCHADLEQKCEDESEDGLTTCRMCCTTDGCNGDQFVQHKVDDAKKVIDSYPLLGDSDTSTYVHPHSALLSITSVLYLSIWMRII